MENNNGPFLSENRPERLTSPFPHRSKHQLAPWVPLAIGGAGGLALLVVIGLLVVQLDLVGKGFRAVQGVFDRSASVKQAPDPLAKALSAGLGKDVESEYTAVFLTNKQVYFGVLEGYETEPVLKDVYYLRTQPRLQESTSPEGNTGVQEETNVAGVSDMTLIKLGNELHGPTDSIQINRDHILFVERLREDSRVVQAIRDYKTKQGQ